MIGCFINFDIFQRYQSPSLARVFAFVVVVVVVGAVAGVIIVATIAVVAVYYYFFFIGEGCGRVKG